MSAAGRQATVPDADRLPWLEPYREAPASAPRAATSGRGGLVAVGAVVGLSAALAGGYWLGQRESNPVQVAAAEAQPIPVAPVAPPPAVEARQAEVAPAATAPASARPQSASRARPKARPRQAAARPRIRRAGVETNHIDAVREQQGEIRPVARAWPKLPSPGPAGRVIQLGAFSHPDRAFATYQSRLARYPKLRTMPRVIVPVARGRDGQLLYVLRLGTASRVQSKQVCRNLRRSGDHCLVIG